MRIDEIEETPAQGKPQPTREQILFRLAVEEALLPKQKVIWDLWNYDRLTQVEIATKLNRTQGHISRSIRAIEKRLIKWVKDHDESSR